MKRSLKIFISLLAVIIAASALCVTAFADSEAEIPAEAYYKIIDADGNVVKVGMDEDQFPNDISALEDGQTFVALRRLKVGEGVTKEDPAEVRASTRAILAATAEEPKTVNIDLAGNEMIFVGKLDVVAISVRSYVTCNVYSSKPGGYIRSNFLKDGSEALGGDPVFGTAGSRATLNVGKYVLNDGTEYPGSNLAATGVAVFSGGGDNTCYINIDGGTYVRNSASDHRAFFLVGSGNPNISVKNSNILTGGFAVRLETGTILFENCVVSGYNGSIPTLVNTSPSPSQNHFYGTMILKNSVINAKLTAVMTATNEEGAITKQGRFVVMGNTIFQENYLTPEVVACLEGVDEKVIARANGTVALLDNGTNAFKYMGGLGNDDYVDGTVSDITNAVMYSDPSNVTTCIFYLGSATITEQWDKDQKVEFPFEVSGDALEGVYKYGVVADVVNATTVKYRLGLYADFNILVSVDATSALTVNVYIPQEFYEQYMDVTESLINGNVPHATMYSKVNYDGKTYYKVPVSVSGEEVLSDINVSLRGIATVKSKSEIIYGDWSFSILDYCNSIKNTKDAKLEQVAYDLANLVKTYADVYLADTQDSEAYNEVVEFISDKGLSEDSAEVKALLEKTVNSASLTGEFAKAELLVSSGKVEVRFNIPKNFEGVLKISAKGYGDSYEIKGGKHNKNTYVSLYLPCDFFAETLTVKAYDSAGALVGAEAADITGVYAMQNGYANLDEQAKSVVEAVLGYLYSSSKYFASIPATK